MRIEIDGMSWSLKDYIGTKVYENGTVMHPTGWEISVDQTDDGWVSSAVKRIQSDVFEQVLAQTNPQHVKSGPRSVLLLDKQSQPHLDTAGVMMWEWLDKHAGETEARFVETGRFDDGIELDVCIPLSSSVKEKPALSLVSEAGF
jgi:hypothetical protein